MDLRLASCRVRNSLRVRVCAQADAFSPVKGPSWWSAGLAPVATSLIALVAVAAPATGATSRSSPVALAGAGETLDGTSDLSALPTADTPVESVPTTSPEVAGAGSAAPAPQSQPTAGENLSDIAQTGAVSPAIAHGQLVDGADDPVDSGGVTATDNAVPASTQPAETGFAGDTSDAAGNLVPVATSPAEAPLAKTGVTTRPAVKGPVRPAPSGWRYRSQAHRYHLPEAAVDRAREVVTVSDPNVQSNTPQEREVIPQAICEQISCEGQVANVPAVAAPAPGSTSDPTIEPGEAELISSLLGQLEGDEGCGNTNVSFRVGSPGDDGKTSQNAAAGDCGRNTNVSIRINSPGDNGPVSQSVGTMDAIMSRFSSLLRASRPRQMGPAQAGSQPGYPYLGVNPATLPGRLERSARRLAWSLVAQAQARANRALPQAAPRRARERSRSSVRVSAYASSSAGRARVAASARVSIKSGKVSIKTSLRTKRARGKTTGTSLEVPRSRENRLTASPRLGPEAQSGSGSGRGAILIALLAALVGAYLLVPPFRSAHALGVSRFWPKRGEPPQ
jgi:hypothetical protein